MKMKFIDNAEQLTKQEKDIIVSLVLNSYYIEMNANDFYAYSSGESVQFQPEDLPWIIEIIKKHGFNDGKNACMSYIRNEIPISPYLTEGFTSALKDIEEMGPYVWSEDGRYRPKEEQTERYYKWYKNQTEEN